MTRSRWTSLATLICSVSLVVGTAWSFRGTAEPSRAAASETSRFLKSLTDEQRSITVYEYGSPERVGWHFVPKDTRKGLPVKSMTDAQRDNVAAILKSVLSEVGYDKVSGARRLEGLVRDLEGEGRRWARDPNEYYLTIFGQPSKQGQWGLSFEGHHVSMNFSFDKGRIVGSTPQFLGSHPAKVLAGQERVGLGLGYQLLGDEESLAFELAGSLTDAQRSVAKTSDKAPKEILGAGEAQPPYESPRGLPGREMTEAQLELLSELVARYAEVACAPVAQRRLIDINGLDNVSFSYAGSMKSGEAHGYMVQGPTFVIEYVNSQADAEGNPANHAHAIWRDMRGDFALEK